MAFSCSAIQAALTKIIGVIVTLGLLGGCDCGYDAARWDTRLHWAAAERGAATIQQELNRGIDVNARDRNGNTPLILACGGHGSPSKVATLLRAGADVDASNARRITPLMVACTVEWHGAHSIWREHEDVIEVVRLLLNAHPQLELRDAAGMTALMHAARNGDAERLGLLIQAGAALEAQDPDGSTPLMLAAQYNASVVNCLLTAGADVNAQDKLGCAALMRVAYARYADPASAMALLAAGARLEDADTNGWTATMHAAWFASTNALIRTLLNAGASAEPAGWSPLTQAAICGDVARIDALLASGADADARDRFGRTSLMWAARFIQMDGGAAIRSLIRGGADVNAKDAEGMTALMIASNQAWLEEIDTLMRSGANRESVDSQGRTALMHAAMSNTAEYKVELLLKHRASVNVVDGAGRTALMFAAGHADVKTVDLLLNAGADPHLRDSDGRRAIDYARDDSESIDQQWIVKRLMAAEDDGNEVSSLRE